MLIHGTEVRGREVDSETRCAHYHSPLDVIALRFKCCGEWFPCFECHREIADHEAQVIPRAEFDSPAVLCGVCGHKLTANEYFVCGSNCPKCDADFNPGCANHYDLYFQT